MPEPHIPYRIEQTKNRHSRAVYKEDTIVIRLAKNLSMSERKKHIDSLLQRMTIQIRKSKKRVAVHPFQALLEGSSQCTITMGDATKHIIKLRAEKASGIQKTATGWNVSVGPTMHKTQMNRLLWNAIATYFHDEITALVHLVNAETLHVHTSEIRLRYFTSQWGSCAPNGTISINTALLFLPKHLLHYVIVHELAHRKHANHSHNYWQCVADVLPSYKEDRNELKKYKLLPL